MNLEKAVNRLNADRADKVAKQALGELLGSRAALRPGSPLDAADIERALAFLEDLGEDRARGGRYKEYVTLAEWLGAGKKGLSADPSAEGVPLDPDGVSQDSAEVSWEGVEMEARLLVLLGRRLGKLSAHPTPETRHAWAEDLRAGGKGQVWQALRAELAKMRSSEREALEQMLVYQRAAAPAPVPAPSVPVYQLPSLAQEAGIPLVFTLHDQADTAHARRLQACSALMKRNGTFQVVLSSDCPPGQPVESWLSDQLINAHLVLVLQSVDFAVNQRQMGLAEEARRRGKRLIPVRLRPAQDLWPQLVNIPDQAVTTYSVQDTAWVEVLGRLARALA